MAEARRALRMMTSLLVGLVGLGLGAGVPAAVLPSAPPIATGALRCVGASTMQPLVAAWARAFASREPGTPIDVPSGTHYSAAGVAAVVAGQANCITFAREPFAAEQTALRTASGQAVVVVP